MSVENEVVSSEKYDIPISSFLTKSLKDELDYIAKRDERTISFLIRKAVEKMIVDNRICVGESWPTCNSEHERETINLPTDADIVDYETERVA